MTEFRKPPNEAATRATSTSVGLPLLVAVLCLLVLGGLRKSQEVTPLAAKKDSPNPSTQVQVALTSKSLRVDEVDPVTGLRKAPGWELVAANCSGCHSTRLVVQNRGNREHWLSMIRWMQKTQNLWLLAPDVEDAILRYLSTQYGEGSHTRRAALPEDLLPPYQYATSVPGP